MNLQSKPKKKGLLNIDSRIIWLLLLFFVGIPLVRPIGIPITVSQNTRDFYEILTEQSGITIALALDTDPAGLAELGPQISAILKIARDYNFKVVMVGWNNNAGMFANTYLTEVFSDVWNSEYGITFVNLGYVPGGETGMKQFAEDVWSVGQDHYGTQLENIPMMKDIRTASDIDYLIEFCWNLDYPNSIMRQFTAPGYTKMLAASTALVYPALLPFIGPELPIKSAIKGMDGAAMLELLSKHPGLAIAGTDAQSLAHILIIIFIAIGNFGLFLQKEET